MAQGGRVDSVPAVRRHLVFFSGTLFVLSVGAVAFFGCGSDDDDAAASSSGAPAASTSSPEDGGTGWSGDSGGEGAPQPSDSGGGTSSPLIDERPYAVKVPANYDPAVPTPLVVSLHGYTGNAQVHEASRQEVVSRPSWRRR